MPTRMLYLHCVMLLLCWTWINTTPTSNNRSRWHVRYSQQSLYDHCYVFLGKTQVHIHMGVTILMLCRIIIPQIASQLALSRNSKKCIKLWPDGLLGLVTSFTLWYLLGIMISIVFWQCVIETLCFCVLCSWSWQREVGSETRQLSYTKEREIYGP